MLLRVLLWLPLVVRASVPRRLGPFLERDTTIGPISTADASLLPGGRVVNDAPPLSTFFDGLDPPFPTNAWWTAYAARPGNATAAGPFPYESAMDGYGMLFGVSSKRSFDGTSIKQPTQFDWLASFAEHQGNFANHRALSYDTQTVTVQHAQGSASMTSYLVPGSPYMTFKYQGATPSFKASNGDITSFNGKAVSQGNPVTASGTSFTIADKTGTTYVVYANPSISLTASSPGTFVASSTYNGIIRFVKLADPSHKTLLDQHSNVYPVSLQLGYNLSDSHGVVSFTWNTAGGSASDLLMLTWPHHRLAMRNPNFPATTSLGYLTTKGWMYPAIGNSWQLLYQLSNITWNPPRALDSSCSSAVLKGLQYQVSQLNASSAPVPNDFYYWGGNMAAQSRLALIADNIGQPALRDKVVSYLKASFANWFQNGPGAVAAFETTWGGVVDKAGAENDGVDFGNGIYNDHHFHYGYFLTVAAVIAKFDHNWLNQHKDFVNLFARDIINASPQDPYFPIARCRDWFAGHSWASGVANGASGKDQESSSEAVNGYYGALLWASVAIPSYVNYAKLLVATEVQAVSTYWHLDPSISSTARDNPYPEAGVRNLISMGNVQDWQAGAWLFWGMERTQISGIQMLPVTPMSEVLYDPKWVTNVWSYTAQELSDPKIEDSLKNVIMAGYSNANPQAAAIASTNITDFGTGNTYTNEMFFIGTRPNPSGSPICGQLPQNPYGNFTLQIANSNQKIIVGSDGTLTSSSSGTPAVFISAYVPNSGTLQLSSNKQYLTADSSGTYAVSVSRNVASTWERFVIRQKPDAARGVYTIKAASNGLYLVAETGGRLYNNGTTQSAGTGFQFIAM